MKYPTTILIAEDNDNELALLKHALTKNHLNNPIQVCRDGQETIDYLCGEGRFKDRLNYPFPGVLFLDLKMPKRSGLEVLEWIKAHPECSVGPVMVLTNSRLEDDIKRAYQLGANAYMVKPAKLSELAEIIETACKFWTFCERPKAPEDCHHWADAV
jgi:CheY-like chemotaxis protein